MEKNNFSEFINLISSNNYFNNIINNNIYFNKSLYLIKNILNDNNLLNIINNNYNKCFIILLLDNTNNIDNDLDNINNYLISLKEYNKPKFIIYPKNINELNYDNNKYYEYIIFNDLEYKLNNNINKNKYNIINKLYNDLIKYYDKYIKELILFNKLEEEDIKDLFYIIKPIININYIIKCNEEMIKQIEDSIFIIKFDLSLEFIINSIQDIINNNQVILLNGKCSNIINYQNNLLELILTFNNYTTINKLLFINRLKTFIKNNYYIFNKFNYDICMVINGNIY